MLLIECLNHFEELQKVGCLGESREFVLMLCTKLASVAPLFHTASTRS